MPGAAGFRPSKPRCVGLRHVLHGLQRSLQDQITASWWEKVQPDVSCKKGRKRKERYTLKLGSMQFEGFKQVQTTAFYRFNVLMKYASKTHKKLKLNLTFFQLFKRKRTAECFSNYWSLNGGSINPPPNVLLGDFGLCFKSTFHHAADILTS